MAPPALIRPGVRRRMFPPRVAESERWRPGDYFGAYGLALGTPGNSFSWYTNGGDAGAALSIDPTGGRNGKPAIKCQATAPGVSAVGFTLPAGNQRITYWTWIRVHQVPTGGSASVCAVSGMSTNPGIQITTGGVLRAFCGSNVDAFSQSLVLDRDYFLMCSIDCSSTTFRVWWQVWDDVTGTLFDEGALSSPGGDTPGDVVAVRFINNAAAAQWGDATHVGGWQWDMGWSPIYTTWPIPIVETALMPLAAVGSHNLGAGSFTKTGAVAITGADATSYTELTERPPDVASFVSQTAIDGSAFVEYAPAPITNDPLGVKVYSDNQGSAAGAYTMEVRGSIKGTDTADVTSGGTKSATTDSKRALTIARRPDGQPLLLDDVNAMRLRFGYAGDVTPNPLLAALFAEVLQARTVPAPATSLAAPPLLAQVI